MIIVNATNLNFKSNNNSKLKTLKFVINCYQKAAICILHFSVASGAFKEKGLGTNSSGEGVERGVKVNMPCYQRVFKIVFNILY